VHLVGFHYKNLPLLLSPSHCSHTNNRQPACYCFWKFRNVFYRFLSVYDLLVFTEVWSRLLIFRHVTLPTFRKCRFHLTQKGSVTSQKTVVLLQTLSVWCRVRFDFDIHCTTSNGEQESTHYLTRCFMLVFSKFILPNGCFSTLNIRDFLEN